METHVKNLHLTGDPKINVVNPLRKVNDWKQGSESLNKLKDFDTEQIRQQETRKGHVRFIATTTGGLGAIVRMLLPIVGLWWYQRKARTDFMQNKPFQGHTDTRSTTPTLETL